MAETKRSSLSAKGGPVVLVIDDSDIDRATITELLSAAGCEVHGLPSPIGATRIARQLQVQVVVIDQNLPAMDGSKLAALFHGNPGMRDIRVVLISGNEEQHMLDIAKQAQVSAFVSKRELHQKLVPTVKRLTSPAG
jgi:CheY-like chemotaxis protein